jgi:hypothetical protein
MVRVGVKSQRWQIFMDGGSILHGHDIPKRGLIKRIGWGATIDAWASCRMSGCVG